MTATTLDSETADSIKSVISRFFDAVNASDTKALQKTFLPSANLVILRQDPPAKPSSPLPDADNKVTVVIRTSIETFIKMINDAERKRKESGKKGPKLHEQPDLDNTDIKLDSGLAMAWSPFEVFFDDKLHHYGTMIYVMAKQSGEWKIDGLTQNYRRTPGWEDGHAAW